MVYGIVVICRNILFDIGILKSKAYDLPIISIGNITVGGTGKTPHTEFITEFISREFKVAVLSRGYKRKTKGFLIANGNSTSIEIGDEPIQIKRKFPDVLVAVDEKRVRGIDQICELKNPVIDVILLDDAYQHRKVKPAISVLLIDYNRLISKDYLLPAGNLREPAYGAKRADMIVVTKCPENLKPIELRVLSKKFNLYPQQSLYFSRYMYDKLKPLLPTNLSHPEIENKNLDLEYISSAMIPVIIIAGIATPEHFINYIRHFCPDGQAMVYPDHYRFKEKDILNIKTRFEKIKEKNGLIITTEKDSTRMLDNILFEDLSEFIYYLPICVDFYENQNSEFQYKILEYVRTNKRNC
jgi:tetraacyldisaccharide 4'-kinase